MPRSGTVSMDATDSLRLIASAVASLHEAGMIEEPVSVTGDTILLGAGSPLDSMSFVAFITELEDRLTQALGRDVFLLFDDIHEFNPDKSRLTAATLGAFITRLASAAGG